MRPIMDPNVPIAIIGMSCRFPGNVKVPEDLWQLCAEGRTGWSKIPASRFNLDEVYHPNAAKTNTVCSIYCLYDRKIWRWQTRPMRGGRLVG